MNNKMNFILENEWLIYKIINKYKNHFEVEDLYQVGVIGLIKAHDNYKEKYNTKFTTYAYPYVVGEVLKYINNFRSIKINKDMRMLYSKILKGMEILSQKLMKNPTAYELSLFLEIDEKIIEEVLIANSKIDSLDKIISSEDKNLELYNTVGYLEKEIENCPLNYAIDNLSNEERNIIEARFFDNMSQREVGETLGMYQVEVSRKEKKILKKLYNDIAA